MKILQISCGGLGKGGVQKVIMDITENLVHENVIDIVLFTNERRHYDDRFEELGGKIYRINSFQFKNKILKKINYYIRGPKIFISTLKILKQNQYDVIHCHNEYESGICLLASHFAKTKIRISHLHKADYDITNKSLLNRIYNKLLKHLICKYSTNIMCCSNNTKNAFKFKDDKKVTVILNSIDLKKFKANSKKSNKYFNITHVGQFSDNKNQLFILDIINLLRNEIENINLNLIGFGEKYKNKIINKVKKLEIDKYVNILPENSDIPKILSESNLFIFPSKKEGLGIVLFEAQAMNVPCIASDTVSDETNLGLVIYKSLKENANAWCSEILNIHNKEKNLQLDKNKLKELDISNYINKIVSIYKGATNNENRNTNISKC